MAKRFIDTNIFRKNFVRGLSASKKVLWVYLFCDCSHAGIWEIDLEIASIFTGTKVTLKDIESFGDRVLIFDNNTKVFIPEFIEFQYGILKANNNAHLAVIRDLKKYGFIDENLQIIKNQIIEPLTSSKMTPDSGALDKDMDKDKEKDMDSLEKPKSEIEIIPYQKIVDEFNSVCKNLPKVQALSDSRKAKIKARWGEIGSIDKFHELFNKTQNTPFLIGNNDRSWVANFDWLMDNDKNWLKVLEGAYEKQTQHGNTNGSTRTKGSDFN